MTESDPVLATQIDELRRRIDRLEQHVGMAPEPVSPVMSPERAPDAASEPPVTAPPPTRPVVAAWGEAGANRTVEALARLKPKRGVEAGAGDSHSPPLAPPTRAERETPTWSVEQVVGAKFFAAVGAVIVVIGVGLFLKLAYDRGWMNQIPPGAKCWVGTGFGLVLLGLGEWTRRRFGALASAGVSAAGIGTLYAVAYGAYGVYGLIPAGVSFVLLAGVAGLGIAVAGRAGLVSVALLSMVGAYLVPIILRHAEGHPAVMPAYLVALLGLGLGLSGWRPDPFHHLRRAAWWGTALLGTPWVFGDARQWPMLGLGFLAVVWGAVHGELSASAARGGMSGGDSGTLFGSVDVRHYRAARPLITSLSTTAWCSVLGVFLAERWVVPEWVVPAAGVVAAGTLAIVLAGRLRVFCDVPETDGQRLGAVLMMQAGALLIAAIALAVEQPWVEVVTWLAMGLAAVAAGRWIGSRGLDGYGVVVLSIAAGRLVLLRRWLDAPAIDFAGLHLTWWTALMAIAGISWFACARLLLVSWSGWRRVAVAAAAVGMVLVMASVLNAHEAAPVSVVWLAVGVVVACLHRLERRLALDVIGSTAVVAAMAPWAVEYVPEGYFESGATIGLHGGLLIALTICAVLTGLGWEGREQEGRPGPSVPGLKAGLWSIAGGFLLVATSFEVARAAGILASDSTARLAAVSVWWGLFAVGAIVIGFTRRVPGLRYAGLGLLGLAACKAVVYDLAEAPQTWRVASFVGLGLLMLLVAVGYSRVSARVSGPARAGDDGGRPPEHGGL
ncbi:MAG: DUF2339 domain-containing protein [Phycisphaeraceae bacterium]|nr:DUF2339 domain-containing protein [Phycisphaeraceae bacterium]